MTTDNTFPVITCRKMKPSVPSILWCRSCTLNLKKRCEGLQNSLVSDDMNSYDPSISRKRSRSGDLSSKKPYPHVRKNSIDEHWVQCEGCAVWRRLPDFIDLKTLPEQWYCTMNIWDTLANKCVSNVVGRKDRSPRPSSAQELQRRGVSLNRATPPVPHSIMTPKSAVIPTYSPSLAEALGLKTVEKVKALCRVYGVRTTRAGTNGGRKSKGELIGDLLQAGLTRLDDDGDIPQDDRNQKRSKARRRSPLQFPVPVVSSDPIPVSAPPPMKPIPHSPLFAAIAVVEARDARDSQGLDNLAEVACLALGLKSNCVSSSFKDNPWRPFQPYSDRPKITALPLNLPPHQTNLAPDDDGDNDNVDNEAQWPSSNASHALSQSTW